MRLTDIDQKKYVESHIQGTVNALYMQIQGITCKYKILHANTRYYMQIQDMIKRPLAKELCK